MDAVPRGQIRRRSGASRRSACVGPATAGMAPSRRKGGRGGKKVEAFLRDFDREVEMRVSRIQAEAEVLLQEVEDAFHVELLRVPRALRLMNWRHYYALGDIEKALEKAASADLDITEITRLASEAVQTPFKSVRKPKKIKRAVETISKEAEAPQVPVVKRARQDGASGLLESSNLHHKRGKAKTSAKKVPVSKRSRPSSSRSTRFSKRPSRGNYITPASQPTHALTLGGSTSVFTPKFDSSVFKTPGLRVPATHERVYHVSVNGSPLGDNNISITVPVGGGENIHLRASELSKCNLMQLHPEALGRVEKLSAQLVNLCSGLKGRK